jgi:hypothetical protein
MQKTNTKFYQFTESTGVKAVIYGSKWSKIKGNFFTTEKNW